MGMGLSASQFKDPRLAELIGLIVAEINEKHDTTAIVEAIISLARSLYIEVVAEGVETTDQRDFLVSRGCALLQGYLFHAALPSAKMEALAASSPAAHAASMGVVTPLRPRSVQS